jgi:hypothetical protein
MSTMSSEALPQLACPPPPADDCKGQASLVGCSASTLHDLMRLPRHMQPACLPELPRCAASHRSLLDPNLAVC